MSEPKLTEQDILALSHWDHIDGHPVADWKYEVDNDDTRLGYKDWAIARIEDEEEDRDE